MAPRRGEAVGAGEEARWLWRERSAGLRGMFGGRANEHAQVIALTLLHLLICVTPVATNPLTRYDHSIANTSPPRTRRRAAPAKMHTRPGEAAPPEPCCLYMG